MNWPRSGAAGERWSFYLDLEESLGTIETCRAAYERLFELKVVTPQLAMNYADFLEENDFFEDSFRVYEQAVSLFTYPQLKTIWLTYLDKFMNRYGGTKLERLRDIFEQSIVSVPAEFAAEFYLKYFKAEEAYGMARHALAVLDRATRSVPESRRLDMYRLYIKKVEQHFGVTKVRPVYERAISELSDDQCRQLCLEYADVERKLGEVDRARAILQHGSQFSDPRREAKYWLAWKEFEEAHGNEDTFRDMLRVQRSVETAYSQANYLASEMVAGEAPASAGASMDALAQKAASDAAQRAEQGDASSMKRKFVPSSTNAGTGAQSDESQAHKFRASETTSSANRDEIDIDDVDAEDEAGVASAGIVERPVPRAVFGDVSA